MISAVAPTDGSLGGAPVPGGGEQPREIRPEHHRDRGRLRRCGDGPVGVRPGPWREAEPGHLAVVAQPIEPGRLDSWRSRRAEQLRLPGDRRRLEALQLLDDDDEAGCPGELGARGDVLPAQQEPHEVLGGRRRVPVAAGPAGVACACGPAGAGRPTPYRWHPSTAGTGPAGRTPRAAARPERSPPVPAARLVPPGQLVGGGDPRRLQVAAHHPGRGGVVVAGEGGSGVAAASVAHHSSVPPSATSLGPASADQLVPQRLPVGAGRHGDE